MAKKWRYELFEIEKGESSLLVEQIRPNLIQVLCLNENLFYSGPDNASFVLKRHEVRELVNVLNKWLDDSGEFNG